MAPVRVMSWNILHRAPCEEERDHPWAKRKAAVRAVVERERPDILLAQEAYAVQMDDMLEGLPDHWWFGRDRWGTDDGEGCPIAYDTRRFRLRERGQFWLGAFPDLRGSHTWTNDVPRVLTWGLFEERDTGLRLRVANTHLDHLVPATRRKAVHLLRERLPRGSPEEPVLLGGDFNSPAIGNAHRVLTRGPDGFRDLRREARGRASGRGATFHGFQGVGLVRMDWILARPALPVLRHRVVRERTEEGYPSDHFPVVVDVHLDGAPEARAQTLVEAPA